MRRQWPVFLCTVLLALAVTLSGCGVDPLALRLKPGVSGNFHVAMDQTMTTTNIQGPEALKPMANLKGNLTMAFDIFLIVSSVENQVATIRYQMSGFKINGTMADKPMPAISIPDTAVTLKLNTVTGEVVDIQGLPQLGAGQTPGLDKEQLSEMIKESIVQLPKSGQAKVGDKWEMDMKVPSPLPNFKSDSTMKVTNEYAGNETQDGFQVAKLNVGMNGTLNATTEQQGMKLTQTGTMSGKGTTRLDLKTGLPMGSDMTTVVKLSQKMEGKQLPGPVVMDMEMNQHIVTTRR